MIFKFVFIFFLILSFAGCLRTRSDLTGQEQTQTNNRKQAENQKEAAQGASSVPEKPAEDKDETMRLLLGRVEVLESQLSQMKSEKEKTAALNQGPTPEAIKIQALQEALVKLESQVQKLEQEKIQAAQAAQAAQIAQAKSEQKQTADMKAGDKDSPKFTTFQIAEAHFKNKDWKKAILSYQKYTEDNSKGKMIPDAKYKIGVSFQELGLKEEAIAFYEEVIAQFPNSETGKKAKFRLGQLKKK